MDAGQELSGMLGEVFAEIDARIEEALDTGWRLPSELLAELLESDHQEGENTKDRLDRLCRHFSRMATFPQGWTTLEQNTLFAQILGGYRDKEGLRIG